MKYVNFGLWIVKNSISEIGLIEVEDLKIIQRSDLQICWLTSYIYGTLIFSSEFKPEEIYFLGVWTVKANLHCGECVFMHQDFGFLKREMC